LAQLPLVNLGEIFLCAHLRRVFLDEIAEENSCGPEALIPPPAYCVSRILATRRMQR
jgi:hypothetical protein